MLQRSRDLYVVATAWEHTEYLARVLAYRDAALLKHGLQKADFLHLEGQKEVQQQLFQDFQRELLQQEKERDRMAAGWSKDRFRRTQASDFKVAVYHRLGGNLWVVVRRCRTRPDTLLLHRGVWPLAGASSTSSARRSRRASTPRGSKGLRVPVGTGTGTGVCFACLVLAGVPFACLLACLFCLALFRSVPFYSVLSWAWSPPCFIAGG